MMRRTANVIPVAAESDDTVSYSDSSSSAPSQPGSNTTYSAAAESESDTVSYSDSSPSAPPQPGRNTYPAAADVIPAPAYLDTASSHGSSSPAPPQSGRMASYSTVQVTRATSHGAPVIPIPGDGHPVAVEEMMSQVAQGNVRSVDMGPINDYLLTWGRIPMMRSLSLDPNAMELVANQPQPEGGPPVIICAYCNYAFCFGVHELPFLLPAGGGNVYPEPPVPITRNLLTPPAVGPLYGDGVIRGPGGTPERLPVCANAHHFKVTMGMLQLPGGALSLQWMCPPCLGVLPDFVGSGGGNSSDLYANPPPPPPEPYTYAGAYWNYVEPGDEDMVQLKLHEDPLNLTLGRR